MSAQKINIPMLGVFLGITAAAAAGLLSAVQSATQPQIQANAEAKKKEAMMQVLPAFVELVARSEALDDVQFTVALDAAGAPVGVAAIAEQEGFSGKVEVMVGLTPDGAIRKVLVTKQTETPGLGTVITDRKEQKVITDLFSKKESDAGLPANQYLDQYETVTADTVWKVTKDGGDIDAKTGATITSRAVCGAVGKVYAAFAKHQDQLLKGAE